MKNIVIIALSIFVVALAGTTFYFWQSGEKDAVVVEVNKEAIKKEIKEELIEEKKQSVESGLDISKEKEALVDNQEGKQSIEEYGIVKKMYEKGGKRFVDIDYVEFYSGEEGLDKLIAENDECIVNIKNQILDGEHKGEAQSDREIMMGYCMPNYVATKNVNPKIRTIEIAKSAKFLNQKDVKVSYEQFVDAQPMFVRILLLDGIIVEVKDYFVP